LEERNEKNHRGEIGEKIEKDAGRWEIEGRNDWDTEGRKRRKTERKNIEKERENEGDWMKNKE